ncbi:cardiolipin synthase [Undibacterium piscinae]|uniref:Cardiolipin synthase n=1 Tax=Undibacterium piscinae TaxID=2495591 RepID=A0A6M4A7Q3_9BURK|nr:cardiolipin synthase [Undibacterium piscinae]
MTEQQLFTAIWAVLFFIFHVGLVARAILRPHREPASRIAWVVVIAVLPIGGMIAYLLLGETSIGRRRRARARQVLALLPDVNQTAQLTADEITYRRPNIPERYEDLFRIGQSVNGFEPVGGNQARLLADSQATIDAIVADIDAAQVHVHLLFYIWLPDHSGLTVVAALKRAAARGVICRVMVDGLGSRIMLRSVYWSQMMREAGVLVATALPIGNPLLHPLRGRIDLRNHRKIVVIDHHITYCGSQNCADPEFRIKAKYAPWVDLMVRFVGPVALQNQHLFVSDWMAQVNEDISDLLSVSETLPASLSATGFSAQVIGTGPTIRYSAMPEVFETLIYAARRELFITTPYFVPDESMLAALCTSARRGVTSTIIFPARNDSWIVAAASRSYYGELLTAGVRIFEYQAGLLHAKSLTMDGDVSLIGSANMDRRSFELNYENNILLYDPVLSEKLRLRQATYLAQSRQVTLEMVQAWSVSHRLLNNTIAMFGPVL